MECLSNFLLFTFIGSFILVSTSYHYDEPESEEDVVHITTRDLYLLQRAAETGMDWTQIANLARDGVIKCKKLNDQCGGFLPCCGSNQCYWKSGYSIIKKGVCVECVQQGQLCQRDMQCCPGFVCQKERVFHINGICDIKRTTGSNCHDTDQCISNRCNFTGWQWARFQEGKCL